MSAPALSLLFFTLPDCASCRHMKRTGVLEKFVVAHPNVKLESHELEDAEDSSSAANKKADAYSVAATPTIVFEHANYGEVAREEGGMRLKDLEDLYEAALERVAYKEGR